MPTGGPEVYNATGTVTSTVTTPLAIQSLFGLTTKRALLVGVRMKIGVTGAVAGNNILFQLCRPGNTPTGTGLASGTAQDFSAPASLAQWTNTWSTAPTVGGILAEWTLPQTTGSMWEEFPPTGDEWGVPAIASGSANAGVHMIVTASVATSTPIRIDFVWTE